VSDGGPLRVTYTDAGLVVTPDPAPNPSWEWGLTLVGYGPAGHLVEPRATAPTVEGTDIEYFRGDLVEGYLSGERAVLQRFTLTAPPAPPQPDPFVIHLALSGNLSRKLLPDGRSAEFLAPGGEAVLRYGDLRATDAEGRDLEARMELLAWPESAGPALRLVVEAGDGVFPVTIEVGLSRRGAKVDSGAKTAAVDPAASSPADLFMVDAPGNDSCGAAEVLPPDGPFPYLSSVTPDVTDATTADDPSAPSCQANVARSIWYVFTPAVTASYTFSSCSGDTATTLEDSVLAIYTSAGGCAGPFTQVAGACDDDSCDASDLQAVLAATLEGGTTYWIVAWQFGQAAPPPGSTAVQLRVSRRLLDPPPNDTCAFAEDIPGGGPFPHLTALVSDITDATSLGDPSPPSCQSNVTRSVWYTFTPTVDADYTVSSCADAPTGTTVDDTVLAVYASSGDCGGPFAEVAGACDDDSCNQEAAQATVTTNLRAGTTYHIVAWKLGAADPLPGSTAVQLRLTRRLPPPNDACASATPLALDAPTAGTTASAFDDYRISGSSCFLGVGQIPSTAPGRDVAYSFTAPATDLYSFRVTGYSPSRNLVVHVAQACPLDPPPAVVTSCLGASNRSTNSSAEEVMCVPLAAGQTAYAVVDETAFTAGSAFRIEVNRCGQESEPNDAPDPGFQPVCGIEGSISPADEADFHALGSPAAESRIFALADGVAANSNDFDLRVTTAADTLEYDDSNADTPFGSLAPSVGGTPVTGVPAHLRVSHFSPIRTSEPYRLYAVVQPPPATAAPEVEPNGTAAQATSSPNRFFSGALSALSDVDLYSFTATAGDLIVLGLDGDPLRNNTPINAALALLDSSAVSLVTAADTTSTSSTTSGSGSLTSKTPHSPAEGLVHRATYTGTYYARVSGATIGDYLLSVSLDCKILPPTDLGVSQVDAPDPVLQGQPLAYMLTVTNAGPSGASNVVVEDVLPAGASLTSATPAQGTCSGAGTLVCFLGDIPAGGNVAIEVIVTPGSPGTIANAAAVGTAVADTSGSNDGSVETTRVCAPPGLDTTCDGVDDDCDALTDEDAVAPAGVPLLAVETDLLSWGALTDATGYDVVSGDLGTLALTAGDFGAATSECLSANHATTTLPHAVDPEVGEGSWFLVRGVNCGGSGTHDSGAGSQIAPRDAGITSSPSSCP